MPMFKCFQKSQENKVTVNVTASLEFEGKH